MFYEQFDFKNIFENLDEKSREYLKTLDLKTFDGNKISLEKLFKLRFPAMFPIFCDEKLNAYFFDLAFEYFADRKKSAQREEFLGQRFNTKKRIHEYLLAWGERRLYIFATEYSHPDGKDTDILEVMESGFEKDELCMIKPMLYSIFAKRCSYCPEFRFFMSEKDIVHKDESEANELCNPNTDINDSKEKTILYALNKTEKDEEISWCFEYTDIDKDTFDLLNRIYFADRFKEKKDVPTKWCINSKRQIAFVHLMYVSPAIVRCGNNECYEEYLFVLHDSYGVIEANYHEGYHRDMCSNDMVKTKLVFKSAEKNSSLSDSEITQLLIEAIKTYKVGKRLDYKNP